MNRVVWKFGPITEAVWSLSMPVDAEVLHAAAQNNDVYVWARVSPEAALAPRRFRLVGTGAQIPDDATRYVGTVLLYAGALVLHVFEATP